MTTQHSAHPPLPSAASLSLSISPLSFASTSLASFVPRLQWRAHKGCLGSDVSGTWWERTLTTSVTVVSLSRVQAHSRSYLPCFSCRFEKAVKQKGNSFSQRSLFLQSPRTGDLRKNRVSPGRLGMVGPHLCQLGGAGPRGADSPGIVSAFRCCSWTSFLTSA